MAKRTSVLCMVWVTILTQVVRADVGVFTGTGQNLRQISTQLVRLESIDVTIVPERGRALFDGGVAGMDQVEFDCRFVLHNLTRQACEIHVGFPIDSQFALPPNPPNTDSLHWISTYGFIARDQKNTYHVTFERTEPKNLKDPVVSLFTWTMGFGADESKTLAVFYHIPMSMTLASTRTGPAAVQMQPPALPWMQILETCMLEVAGYTTETGSSWSGNVGKATFTIITDPFEQYLNYRGLLKSTLADMPPDARDTMKNSYPVHQVWWVREIQPKGSKVVEGGIRWEYQDYKPKEPISISYYLMQYPRTASEVDPWASSLLRLVNDPGKQAGALAIAEQILLATYGKEPVDPIALAFVKDQLWYHPSKNFSLSTLSKERQAIVEALHRRVQSIPAQNRR